MRTPLFIDGQLSDAFGTILVMLLTSPPGYQIVLEADGVSLWKLMDTRGLELDSHDTCRERVFKVQSPDEAVEAIRSHFTPTTPEAKEKIAA